MTVTLESGAPLAVSLDALKAYLRITRDDEDALLESLIRTATDAAEHFIGQVLVARAIDEMIDADGQWKRLGARPVSAITEVAGLATDGTVLALPAIAYAIDIDGNGDGWVRLTQPGAARRLRLTYRAGIAETSAAVPEAIRHGIMRLAGEYHTSREGLEPRPPASVAALWRPWRRMRLS
jgi:uncharacterized phiE125 gp8 family phage protein